MMPVIHVISKLERGGTQRQLFLFIRESPEIHYVFYFKRGDLYSDLTLLPNTKIFHFFSLLSIKALFKRSTEVNFWLYNVFFLAFFYFRAQSKILHIRGSETPENAKWSVRRRLFFTLGKHSSYLPRTKVLSNSTKALKEYHKCGFNNELGDVVDNIVDVSSLNFSKIPWHNLSCVSIRLLHITRKDTQKGNEFFEKLMGHLIDTPMVNFTIVGEGVKSRFGYLESIYKRRLNLYDKVPYVQVIELYRKSDLLVITSLNEGLPNVVVEASHISMPIFYTDVGDIDVYLSKRAKINSTEHFKASSAKEMANQIIRYINS